MNKLRHYQWKLDEKQSVTLDATGAGTMSIVPGGAREKWVVNFTAVSAANVPTTSTNVPQMIVYRGSAVPGNQLAGTFSALLDNNTDTFVLNMNEGLVFVVSGGDVNVVVTVHIEGIRHVWGN